jgi:hypothetical protein
MNWNFCIDTVEKRALNFCRGSMNTGDGFGSSALRRLGASTVEPARFHGNSDDFGCGYGFGAGDGVGGGNCYNDGDGDGDGDVYGPRYTWTVNGSAVAAGGRW